MGIQKVGVAHGERFLLKIDDWDRMIDANLKGALYGIAAHSASNKPNSDGCKAVQPV